MAKQSVRKTMLRVHDLVIEDVGKHIDRSSRYSAALSTEGYAGGYLQALNDVLAYMGGWPSSNSRYEEIWKKAQRKEKQKEPSHG